MSLDRHTCIAALTAGLAALWSGDAGAAPNGGKTCQKNFEQGQEFVRAGQLLRAREPFMECAKTSCGGLISQQCGSALLRLDENTPSVVLVVTDPDGVERTDVGVSVDGGPVSRIDGRSVPLDPGTHEFAFTSEDGADHHEKLLVHEGQRNRVVSVVLPRAAGKPAAAPAPVAAAAPASEQTAAPEATPVASSSDESASAADAPGPPIAAYVVGGVGIAAIGTSFLLAHWGREDNLRLDQCAPNCSQDSVDHVSRMYVAADIALGAGIVALGAATWLYLSHPDGTEAVDSGSKQAYRLDVRPLASGAYATVGGAF